MFDDGHQTPTTRAQQGLEKRLVILQRRFLEQRKEEWNRMLEIKREEHIRYLHRHLGTLPGEFIVLDGSRTWIIYWILHSLSLLNAPFPSSPSISEIITFLGQCQDPEGGFGGGPGQLPHLAATYAAVMSLATIGSKEALEIINRSKLEEFYLRMCVSPEKGGGLTVHENGEVDIRGCYTVMAVAHILNLNKQKIANTCGLVDFVHRCQSFEGGLGGEPGNEAHGGYTFCGLAALQLLDEVKVLNLSSLMRWVVHMQGSMEGGFMGRTHKLVDGCYSFWQGAIFSILLEYHHGVSKQDWWTKIHPPLPQDSIADLEDIPQFGEEIAEEYSYREEAKIQGERKLKNRAKELNLELKNALEELTNPAVRAESGDLSYRARFHQFEECFDDCQSTIQARDCSFSTCFPPGSSTRDQLPVYHAFQPDHEVLYDPLALQFWILHHCQVSKGGFRDKPGESVDLYHTCYCLSGLAIAQQYSGLILGSNDNKLEEIDPTLNLLKKKVHNMLNVFK